MAEEQLQELEESDEFVTLDDDEIDELFEDVPIASEAKPELAKKDKTLPLMIGLLILISLIVSATIYYIYNKKKENLQELNETKTLIQNIQNAQIKKEIQENNKTANPLMIEKSNELSNDSNRDKLLNTREDIALFNNALSHYNLGVAKLKSKELEKAKEEFLISLNEEKLKFESRLNLAIIAYMQKDGKNFEENLQMAYDLLPSKKSSPLYSYYRTLIDYYRGFFAEALVPLHNQSSNYYPKKKLYLNVKLSTLTQNLPKAIDLLQKDEDLDALFPLGILYAKIGNLELSSKYLEKAIKEGNFKLESKSALALVEIKKGMLSKSAKILKSLKDLNDSSKNSLYPIKVILKKSLFDPIYAQKEFQKNIILDDTNRLSTILYFAPYMIIDPKFSSANIEKGVKNIYIDNLNPAFSNLLQSTNLSTATQYAITGIKEGLSGSQIKARDIFINAIKEYPNSSRLHYNLALTYAKMYQFKKALKEFKKSLALDRNNLLSLVFAHYSKLLLHHEDDSASIKDTILNSSASEDEKKRAFTLLAISSKSVSDLRYKKNGGIFDKTIQLISNLLLDEQSGYKESASSLLKMLPHDIVANILELDASMHDKDIKTYAKEVQKRFFDKKTNLNLLLSNTSLPRELYTKVLSIAGLIHKLDLELSNKLPQANDSIGLLQTLGYTQIYLQNFDEAYKIYNHLIDDLKQNDSHTLLLGAIASIGSNHHANAIALLELSKLDNRANLESRFALGLLYLESRNFEGASIEFNKIGDIGFNSQYFDFKLKN